MTTAPQPLSEADEMRLLVHAYHDGELDPANALAVERRLASDPALARESDGIAALRRALREKLPPEEAPAHLRARIARAVAPTATRVAPSWQALAASIVLAAGLSSGATWLALRPAPSHFIVQAAVDSHLRALMAPQPIDVSSSDRHTVKPWFAGRIPQAPRVVDLTQEGFPLVGGRIDVVDGAGVPTLVYRHRQHLISLMAVPAASRATTEPIRSSQQGYNIVRWNADGVAYWAVSDVVANDLEKFARLFREAPPEG
jgi:anti-sigma factor RsiW